MHSLHNANGTLRIPLCVRASLVSPAMMADRSLARDIEAMHHMVAAGDIGRATEQHIPELQALRLA